MRIIAFLLLLSGCTNNLYEVNKRINGYKYIASTDKHIKAPDEFYTDGGGNCKDFANAKKAELGGEIVVLREIINGRTHAVLKVDGWLLDSRFNEIRLAALEKTYPYKGE